MKDVRSKFGNFTEAWKESQCNDRAVAIGCKNLIKNEITKDCLKNLNSTKTQAELKNESLKELRLKADTAIPQWKEDILDSNSQIQGNRQQVIYELSFCQPDRSPLNATKSLNQVKNQVLAEIRRPVPVEAWKEEARNKIAELYNNKREINDLICGKKFLLECAKSQSELRNDLLREIRSKNKDEVVPVWKEKKMMKRTEVHDNKVELNRCIESLNL
jgi:hypothetical protein